MRRVAECVCGQLKVTMDEDPVRVVICNCTYCQKRSGSPYGLSAYFEKERQLVSIEGDHKAFRRTSQRGRWTEHHFCPNCGSAVFWYVEMAPDWIGMAAGTFVDPNFPEPQSAAWVGTKFKWVDFPNDIEIYEEQRI